MPGQAYHTIDCFEAGGTGVPRGFYVVLALPETVGVSPPEPGQSVTVRRPDDTVVTLVCDGTVVNARGVTFLRFQNDCYDDTPRLSEVSWERS